MHTRRPSPDLLLILGLICAVLGAALWATTATITDEHTILNEAAGIAKSEPVREEFTNQIAASITPQSAVSSVDAINLSNDLGRKIVGTPAFVEAFAGALPGLYGQVVDGQRTDVVLDPNLVRQAFAEAGATPPTELQLGIKGGRLPDLRKLIDLGNRFAIAFGILGGFGIVLGLVLSPHRHRAIMRVGRWLITTGIFAILAFWALPTLALLPLGGWIGVMGIVLATGDWMAVPAAVLTAFGIAIVVLGRAGDAGARRQELSVIPVVPGRSPKRASIS